ncbi:MAG: cell wall-binding repeat-containing protein [Candidatus Limnocylindria bacterium]
MFRSSLRSLRLALSIAFVIGLLAPGGAVAATDKLPDLRMAPLTNFYTETSGGERRLRFRTIMTNEGVGPLEVRGIRDSFAQAHLRTRQAIHDTGGGVRLVDSRALMEYAVDGHDHWHVQGVMLYQMWSADGITRRGTKVGFCFLDSYRYNLALPGAPQSQVYPEHVCGDRGDLTNRMGLSVGWGDDYPANFAYQWIDITTLAPGDYTVQARADEQNWYLESNETNNCAYARVRITATNGPVQVLGSGRDCQTAPASTARVERQYGNNRYETAAAASEDAFAPGAPVVYVATGANFPDALAAGAAAGFQGGPVVLVNRYVLPALAITELEGLDPQRIVIVGGTSVISDYVAGLVGRFHTGGGMTRIAGVDRYDTAAAISNAFSPGVPAVYVASGRNWPDALAAVPHAARAGAPILLTLPNEVPQVTRDALTRLQPAQIIVLGGTVAVSASVATALDAYDTGGGVLRLAGADRYATAAAISLHHHPGGAPMAYVATGENFPDALAAGGPAAIRGAPTLLVRSGSVPGPSATELERLNPARIILLGGPRVVSQGVLNALFAYADG